MVVADAAHRVRDVLRRLIVVGSDTPDVVIAVFEVAFVVNLHLPFPLAGDNSYLPRLPVGEVKSVRRANNKL
jgi:hypothetical protein